MDEAFREKLKNLLLSGGLSGAILGAGGKALSGFSKGTDLLKAGALGAGLGGGLSAASGLIGNSLLGLPESGEENPNTKRGSLGGALGGGALGALAGGAVASPRLRGIASKFLSTVGKEAPKIENPILKRLMALEKPAVGAGIGGAAGGAIGAYQGADEGMQLDVIDNAMRERERKKIAEEAIRRQMGLIP